VRPERAVFTHMNHQLDYGDVAGHCPPHVEPGYDGLTITVDDDESSDSRGGAGRG
jgi:phosphoribosyl 1,2-cyclic phosphate phosphodiesterase